MARRAQLTLDTMKAIKPGAVAAVLVEPNAARAELRGQTLRLTIDAWKQLKILAAQEETTAHDLLLEAVNLLFEKRSLPPIA